MPKKLILTVLAVCIILVLTPLAIYVIQNLNYRNKVRDDKDDYRINVKTNKLIASEGVRQVDPKKVNIALLGIDTWDSDTGRSDAIIVMTLDSENKTIKLSSFMRDLRVYIHGHGTSKLGHAFGYGGGELLARTLKDNFGVTVGKYIAVNFSSFAKIIDMLGGLKLNLDSRERDEINKMVEGPVLENAGVQLLNGDQVLAFSRIRMIGKADFERTERQRKVAEELIIKLVGLSLNEASNLALTSKNLLKTNLDKNEAIQLIAGLSEHKNELKIKNKRFPVDGTFRSETISGIFYLIPNDANEAKEAVRDFIYSRS